MCVYCASVCVCMYACMYVYMCMCVHTSMIMCLCMYELCLCRYMVCVCLYIHTCEFHLCVIYVLMCVCVYRCICMGVYVQVMLYVYMFVWHCPQTLKDELPGQLLRFIATTQEWLQQTSGPSSAYIVRKNWLESIVLKQKSIAFGSCPRKFNELIFKAPFSFGFKSVTPGALHTDLQVGSRTAPVSAFSEFLPAPREGPEHFMRKPSRLESPHSTDLPTLREAKGHSAGFQGEEKLIPLLPVRGQSPHCRSWDPPSLHLPSTGWEDLDHVVHLGADFSVRGRGNRKWGGCRRAARSSCIFWSL